MQFVIEFQEIILDGRSGSYWSKEANGRGILVE
jgi:hypothetical protein